MIDFGLLNCLAAMTTTTIASVGCQSLLSKAIICKKSDKQTSSPAYKSAETEAMPPSDDEKRSNHCIGIFTMNNKIEKLKQWMSKRFNPRRRTSYQLTPDSQPAKLHKRIDRDKPLPELPAETRACHRCGGSGRVPLERPDTPRPSDKDDDAWDMPYSPENDTSAARVYQLELPRPRTPYNSIERPRRSPSQYYSKQTFSSL